MRNRQLALAVIVALAVFPADSKAYEILNSAEHFAVLGASTVTSTGNTILNGDLGVFPGLAITGFGPGIVNGTTYAGGPVAAQAMNDALAAYIALQSEVPVQDLTGQDLGGLTLTPGVRNFSSSAQLTGILTLDAQGDAMRNWVFQIGSTLTTASDSSILLINGAQAGNVYWQVGSSATLGVNAMFSGSILADQSITLNTGLEMIGRAMALNGAVTLDGNIINTPVDATTEVPEPATFWLLAILFSAFVVWQRLASRQPRTSPC